MAIDLIVGAVTAVADFLAPAAAAAAPEALAGAADVGAGLAAADVGGAVALPEIAVTAAAPEVAAGAGAGLGADVGLGALGAEAAGGAAAGLAGGFGAGAEALGFGAPGAADLTGGAIAGATPVATEGVTSIAPTAGAALGGGAAGAGGVPSDVFAGTTGPLSALSTNPSTFDQLWQETAGMQPSVDISQTGGTPQSMALTSEPQFSNVDNPLATQFNAPEWAQNINAPSGTGLGVDPFAAETAASGTLTGGTGGPGVFPPASDVSTLPASTVADLGPTGVLSGQPGTSATTLASAASPAGTGSAAQPGFTLTGAGAGVGGAVSPSEVTLDTGAGGGGVSGALSNIFSSSGLKTAATLAPLGALGLTLAKGQPGVPPAEQTALNQANVVGGFGVNQLNLANANQITPAQAAQIDVYKQNAKNQLYQQIANSGQGDPTKTSEWVQGVQQIEQQAVAMQQQFITSMITNGLAATGQANATLQAAANQQVASDAAFQSALTSSLSSFGLVAALSSKA